MSDPIQHLPSPAAELWRRDKAELAAGLVEREQTIRRLQAEQGAILAEMHARGTLAEYGYGSLDTLQADLLHVSKGEARKRKERALACHPTPGIGSAEIPALAPATATAAAAGEIGTEHIDEIIKILTQVPGTVPDEERAGYEGCIKCGRPPKWCIAHHILSWLDGGPTDLHNLCLLCTECHRIIHHSEWRIVMGPDGIPECIAPPWMTAAA